MIGLGLDIGGANLKISSGQRTLSVPFALWREPENLSAALRELLSQFDAQLPLGVTMTGELADCFETKQQGVLQILVAVSRAVADREVYIWQTGGEFVSMGEARELTSLVAAANWHALATWVGRMHPAGRAILIDIGSTTTDIIPIEDGLPMPFGRTDLERLTTGELLYLGVRRTPICSLLSEVPVHGGMAGLAREVFATTLDTGLVLEHLQDDPHRCDTANGRPATRTCARDRLARMLCADRSEVREQEILELARLTHEQQCHLLKKSLRQVIDRWGEEPREVTIAGEGEYLAEAVLRSALPSIQERKVTALSQILGPEHSRGACAFALSRLVGERGSLYRD